MRILGLDAATAACSAALCEDGRVLAETAEAMEHGHAQALMPMILTVMAGHSFASLDAIGVTRGPGGFTGIRVGLATARGLGLAARRPVLGVTTFAAVARNVEVSPGERRNLLVLIESKRRDLYAQLFSAAGVPLAEPVALPPEDLPAYAGEGELLLAGNGAARVAYLFAQAAMARSFRHPEAAAVAALAAELLAAAGPPPSPPAALYLRAPDVTQPKERR